MKYSILMKRFVLALALAALFCLPALAEAEITRTITNETELAAAFDEAQQLAIAATENGTVMEWMNLVVANDFELSQNVTAEDNVRIRVYSTPGQKYTIYSNQQNMTAQTALFMSVFGAELEFKDLIFDGRSTEIGFGAMLNGSFKLTNCVIENYVVSDFLSGLMVALSVVDQTTPNALTMTDCIVRNNKITGWGSSLSILATDGVTTIDNCTFENNVADNTTRGGALAVAGQATIRNSTFKNNVALGGGAIYAIMCNLTVEDTVFTANQCYTELDGYSGEGGGAIHAQLDSVCTIKGCDFTGNTSSISGGAVTAFANTTMAFTDCNFKNNTAVTHGGAFCVADSFSADDSKASRITLNNCLLEGNKANGSDTSGQHQSDPFAPGGGAIYLHEYCVANLNAGTVLKNNYAKIHGGAVYVSFGGRLTVNGAVIENNEAGLDGGAVYVDGANHYAGHSHANAYIPMPDDGFATGGQMNYLQGRIAYNTAGRSGGGVYVGGENEVVVDGVSHVFTGGSLLMSGGVITENKAMDMGGGVYVGACDTGDKGGILEMVDGAIYCNVAGENGNTSDGAQDAGADVYSEGGNAYITVVTADEITAYIRSKNNVFVPADHRSLYFTNWYDDYSDQDPTYGKAPDKTGTGTNTGRYRSSIDPDRMVYKPLNQDHAYNALILDYDRLADVPATGDGANLALWALLACAALAGMALLRRRHA